MSRPRALILDAGGVLVRSVNGEWTIPANYREVLGERARDVYGERWRRAVKAAQHHIREDVVILEQSAELVQRRLFLCDVGAQLGWQLTDAELDALAQDFTYNPDRYAWYDDVEPWLARWHARGDLRIGMLSDAMPSFGAFTRQRGVDKYFDSIVLSTQIGACKPDARMYAEICRRLNVDAGDCLFADDRINNLVGATDFGMRAVQMCRTEIERWDGAAVENMTGLNAYWEALN